MVTFPVSSFLVGLILCLFSGVSNLMFELVIVFFFGLFRVECCFFVFFGTLEGGFYSGFCNFSCI